VQSRSTHNCWGTDVSHWQGDINWGLVKKDGISFAYIKASEGVGYQDRKFGANWREAKEAGLLVGAYHFCTPSSVQDAIDEAGYFVSVVKKHGGFSLLDLPPVIDIEKNQGLTKKEISEIVRVWVNQVKTEADAEPVIYSYTDFINRYLDQSLATHPLWLAHYGSQLPPQCSGWKSWLFLQHTDKGRIGGINGHVDLNEFNGPRDGLLRLCRKNAKV